MSSLRRLYWAIFVLFASQPAWSAPATAPTTGPATEADAVREQVRTVVRVVPMKVRGVGAAQPDHETTRSAP